MRATLAILAAAVAAFLAAPAGAAEQAVAVPGTRIVMAPPPDFARNTNPLGFVSKAPGAAILVAESQPGTFEATRRAATRPDQVRKMGGTLLDVGQIGGFPYEHVFTHATRLQDKVTVDVWTLVFRHPEITGTVSGSVARIPKPPTTAEAIRAALASVRVGAVSTASLIAALPFAVDAPKRFAYRNTLGGRQLVLKETPPPPEGTAGDVTVNIALTARDTIRPPDRADFARQRTFGLASVQVESADQPVPVTVGGLPAMEVFARGTTSAGQPRKIYYVALFAPSAVYTIVAVAQPARFDAALDDVQALARSFKAK